MMVVAAAVITGVSVLLTSSNSFRESVLSLTLEMKNNTTASSNDVINAKAAPASVLVETSVPVQDDSRFRIEDIPSLPPSKR